MRQPWVTKLQRRTVGSWSSRCQQALPDGRPAHFELWGGAVAAGAALMEVGNAAETQATRAQASVAVLLTRLLLCQYFLESCTGSDVFSTSCRHFIASRGHLVSWPAACMAASLAIGAPFLNSHTSDGERLQVSIVMSRFRHRAFASPSMLLQMAYSGCVKSVRRLTDDEKRRSQWPPPPPCSYCGSSRASPPLLQRSCSEPTPASGPA